MKKVISLVIAVACAVALFVFLRPAKKEVETKKSPDVSKVEVKPATEVAQVVPPPPAEPAPKVPAALNDALSGLRTALLTPEKEGVDDSYMALLNYINAHPDNIDEYIGVLRGETNEHVLRRFTFAIAESEVGLQANDQIVGTVIELAKNREMEQRQHIMLHLMSRFPEMRDDVYDAVMELAQQDPNPQVKTSAVTVLADWIDTFPDKTVKLLDEVQKIFNSTEDDDVRNFGYQLFALHTEKLPSELHQLLGERLMTEPDSYVCNLIASALVGAPENIKKTALEHVQSAFEKEKDEEKRRNLLAQIVCLARENSLPLLAKNSSGESLLALDAKDYEALLATGQPLDSETIFMQKAIRDALIVGHEDEDAHKEEKDGHKEEKLISK